MRKIEPDRICALKLLFRDHASNPVLLNQLLTPVSASSAKQYGRFWSKFASFVIQRFDGYVSSTAVIEFFSELIASGHATSSLQQYRCALKVPLKAFLPSFDLYSSPVLLQLFRHSATHYKRPVREYPAWDLDRVLSMFRGDGWRSKDPGHLLKKALFLVLLAAPSRGSEFLASTLSSSTISSDFLTLRAPPHFFAKNHSHAYAPSPVPIPSFAEDLNICPVHTFHLYREMLVAKAATQGVDLPDKVWLDVSLKPLTKVKLRQLFREVIFEADPNAAVCDTRLHSVTGNVASPLWLRGFSVDAIMVAMRWKSSTTFRNFYIKYNVRNRSRCVLAGSRFPSELS